MSSSSTRSGTICRSAVRCSSVLGRLELQRQMEQQPGPCKSLQDLLVQLEVGASCAIESALLHCCNIISGRSSLAWLDRPQHKWGMAELITLHNWGTGRVRLWIGYISQNVTEAT